jgi:hypothetical protein
VVAVEHWWAGFAREPQRGRRFHKSLTLSAIAQMLHRHGFSHQAPARRAVERNEEAVMGWVMETWTQVGNSVATLGASLCFEDEAGFSMTPPTARTWARRGHTLVTAATQQPGQHRFHRP